MRLQFLGAAREVGRSAILLQTDRKILLDYVNTELEKKNTLEKSIFNP